MKKATALGVAFGALVWMSGSAWAADQLARLTIDVTVEGVKNWKNGQDYSNSKISEQYHLMTHVQSSGEPSSVNIKDPQFAQQQMATAAQVQQKVREAQARAGKPVPKAAATQEEYLEQQKKLAEDVQTRQLACKGEMTCLMKVAQEYAQQSAMMSYPPADGAAPTANFDDEEEAPEEERYLNYSGYEGCPGEVQIRINNTSEGAMADVSGMVPFKQADTADYRGTEHDLMMQCLASTLVYDLKERKFYSDGIGHPGPRGSYRYWDSLHGETLNEDAEVIPTSIAWEWVANNLRIADAAGSASTTMLIPGGEADSAPAGGGSDGSQVSGEIKVSMKWKFEPL
jgi:hypothetical protein